MTPPLVNEHAVDLRSRPTLRVVQGGSRPILHPGDIPFLTDAWLLLAILWTCRAVAGRLHPAVAVFGIFLFASLVIPKSHVDGLRLSALDDAGTILRRSVIAYAIGSATAMLLGVAQPGVLLFVAAATVPVLLAGRTASYAFERSMRRRGQKARTLVVGGGEIARRLIANLAAHDEYGLDVVGAVDENPKFGPDELGTRVLGHLGDIPTLVSARNIDVVIVAFSAGDQSSLPEVIRGAMAGGARVWVIPRFFELGSAAAGGDHIWGLPVVKLQPPARNRPQWAMKRAFDFVVSLGLTLLFAPLMGLLAGLIVLESGRPVLFRQRRVGRDGREFQIMKFRSMTVVDEARQSTEWQAEARVTRVGRFLRASGLDELPQLFNVLKGDMSLVGPRPERPHFVEMFSDQHPQYYLRHRLPPGITGWSQVHGLRGDTSIEERAVFDNYYIENWSLSQDLKIFLRTVLTLIRREGN